MPLVDPQILGQRQSPDLMGAYQQGVQTRGLLRRDNAEQQKAQRMKAFEQAFDQASRGLDLTNAENMGNVLKQTFQAFPEETMETAKKYADAFPQAKAKDPIQDDWQQVYGAESPTLYNRRNAETKAVASAKPTESPIAWKGEKFVRAKNNTMVKVDAQGRDKDGNAVELWTPPAKPKAMPTPKPPSPIKALSGDASKLLSISWTLQDDIKAMNQAFSKDFAGSIAGIKSGTNKRLLDLADQIADKVGRLRSGGAVNKDEEARFMRLIATLRGAAFSNAQQASETLNGLAREAQIVMEGIDPDGKHRERIKASQAPQTAGKDPRAITKPEEEDEYQAWKRSQLGR